ncbi:hypothetical protein F5888DRAFT_1886799 [Russula emetica]|nr:hypothetical protein F5888DRAFT_1886799 [Russula emetica]
MSFFPVPVWALVGATDWLVSQPALRERHSVPALQAQNQKLLGIVREMGAKVEADSEEREYREALENEQGEAVRERHPHDVKIQAFTKEGDSLKALLAQTEHNSVGNDSHGQMSGPASESQSNIAKGACGDTATMLIGLRRELIPCEVAWLTTQGQRETRDCRRSNRHLPRRPDDTQPRLVRAFTTGDIECNRVTEYVSALVPCGRNWTHVMNMLLGWKRRTVDSKSATASCLGSMIVSTPTEFQSLKDDIESLKGEKLAWETGGPRIPHTRPSSKKRLPSWRR